MRSRRFHLVMLKILERKRAEKRALENTHRFYCDPKRHAKTPKHPVAPRMAKRRASTQAEPPSPSSAALPTPRGIPTERPTGHYVTLQAPAEAQRQPRTRRKRRPKGINAKRLNAAVERLRKPSSLPPRDAVAEPMVELVAEHPADIWHGGYHPRHDQSGLHAVR